MNFWTQELADGVFKHEVTIRLPTLAKVSGNKGSGRTTVELRVELSEHVDIVATMSPQQVEWALKKAAERLSHKCAEHSSRLANFTPLAPDDKDPDDCAPALDHGQSPDRGE